MLFIMKFCYFKIRKNVQQGKKEYSVFFSILLSQCFASISRMWVRAGGSGGRWRRLPCVPPRLTSLQVHPSSRLSWRAFWDTPRSLMDAFGGKFLSSGSFLRHLRDSCGSNFLTIEDLSDRACRNWKTRRELDEGKLCGWAHGNIGIPWFPPKLL